jgi:hypothetical protein
MTDYREGARRGEAHYYADLVSALLGIGTLIALAIIASHP